MASVEAITMGIADRALGYQLDKLPDTARQLATQCVIDWFAVTLAGLTSRAHTRLFSAISQENCTGLASIIGRAGKFSAAQAALVNGTTAHALDFDDVNLAISGHPSAVIFSALLALGEALDSDGKSILSAFIAGYETACRVGVLVNPGHMNRGHHATGTVCSLGAAVACSHLLGLNTQQTAQAIGLAATSASGLKGMFGTIVKPLHAGLAARNGLEAALWAQHDYVGRSDILECPQGFAKTLSPDFNPEAALADIPSRLHLYNNLFKYDASCYGTHATLECIRQLKSRYGITPSDVKSVRILADRSIDNICNIQNPKTGTEGQFSLRLNAAFALLDVNTADANAYNNETVNAQPVRDLIDRTRVELADNWPSMQAEILIICQDGKQYEYRHDAGVPEKDLQEQMNRLTHKFETLASKALGAESADKLLNTLKTFVQLDDLTSITNFCLSPEPTSVNG